MSRNLPNYERLLQAHIDVVKSAYNDYKKALITWVDNTFIADDGTLGYYEGGLGAKVDELFNTYKQQVALLEVFRNEHADELSKLKEKDHV